LFTREEEKTMETLMAFGDRLKELREAAGMSQEALARAANISTSAVSKLEQKLVDPGWQTVQALARALGVTCQAFESDAPDDQPEAPPPAKKGRKRKGE
jgi:transcriptional regulator with XRE-family HTH domain